MSDADADGLTGGIDVLLGSLRGEKPEACGLGTSSIVVVDTAVSGVEGREPGEAGEDDEACVGDARRGWGDDTRGSSSPWTFTTPTGSRCGEKETALKMRLKGKGEGRGGTRGGGIVQVTHSAPTPLPLLYHATAT